MAPIDFSSRKTWVQQFLGFCYDLYSMDDWIQKKVWKIHISEVSIKSDCFKKSTILAAEWQDFAWSYPSGVGAQQKRSQCGHHNVTRLVQLGCLESGKMAENDPKIPISEVGIKSDCLKKSTILVAQRRDFAWWYPRGVGPQLKRSHAGPHNVPTGSKKTQRSSKIMAGITCPFSFSLPPKKGYRFAAARQ